MFSVIFKIVPFAKSLMWSYPIYSSVSVIPYTNSIYMAYIVWCALCI